MQHNKYPLEAGTSIYCTAGEGYSLQRLQLNMTDLILSQKVKVLSSKGYTKLLEYRQLDMKNLLIYYASHFMIIDPVQLQIKKQYRYEYPSIQESLLISPKFDSSVFPIIVLKNKTVDIASKARFDVIDLFQTGYRGSLITDLDFNDIHILGQINKGDCYSEELFERMFFFDDEIQCAQESIRNSREDFEDLLRQIRTVLQKVSGKIRVKGCQAATAEDYVRSNSEQVRSHLVNIDTISIYLENVMKLEKQMIIQIEPNEFQIEQHTSFQSSAHYNNIISSVSDDIIALTNNTQSSTSLYQLSSESAQQQDIVYLGEIDKQCTFLFKHYDNVICNDNVYKILVFKNYYGNESKIQLKQFQTLTKSGEITGGIALDDRQILLGHMGYFMISLWQYNQNYIQVGRFKFYSTVFYQMQPLTNFNHDPKSQFCVYVLLNNNSLQHVDINTGDIRKSLRHSVYKQQNQNCLDYYVSLEKIFVLYTNQMVILKDQKMINRVGLAHPLDKLLIMNDKFSLVLLRQKQNTRN
ncbi:UNKNOWN [Stylonychia lemnae]|uniref:Uncharacterized protein n=1 Tax=Stylonychia lemnae TaxID=5949 RepID=A0A078AGP3_STYLE|nr:UNKNOWN [Stylonychia lemnae]|eukprot:CDW81455.1 UNKNOWN [Stylonychia lemnae]